MHKLFYLLAFYCISCSPSLPEEVAEVYNDLPKSIDYNLHVKPILSDRCFACHGNDINKLKADLRLDNAQDAYAELSKSPNMRAIVPGKVHKSAVILRILSNDPEILMPPPESNLILEPREKAIIAKWIKQGAEYKDHWAFLAPEIVVPDPISEKKWITNEIDKYVLGALESRGWSPNGVAEKEILLRRLSFDLTGLPPEVEDIKEYLKNDSEKAYEHMVDRFLFSEAYGERMAVDWMDVSRFADTHGYTVDRYRDMSPWRDWVIKAFNDNMPYDQFVTWQLAGDLIPNATKDQILATGFNRNHQQNMEGGIIDEEYRVEYVADRANTLGTVFLGLTVECARCHDHKYDPISQKEYFELFSFFNNVNEAGQISYDNAMPVPTLLMTNETIEEVIKYIDAEIDRKSVSNTESEFKKWLATDPGVDLEINEPLIHLDFNGSLGKATLKQQHAKSVQATFEKNSLKLNGDAWVDLGSLGTFNKDQEFTVSVRIKLPEDIKDGVIFHKGIGAAIYNYKGFHLALRNNELELMMAHNAPDNAITKRGGDLPRNEWVDIALRYDGSSKASGLEVYVNGVRMEMETIVDNLYKDILFNQAKEPGIQIGARWRGVGIKGALIDDFKVFDTKLSEIEIAGTSTGKEEALREYYDLNIHPERSQRKKDLYETRRKKTMTLDTIQEVMVMKEMTEPRQAYVLERGVYDNHGEAVFPNTIKAVLPFGSDYPRNRLGLARWLFDERNPLTARVTVNRIWQQLFGRGIVNSANDFGNQGEMPSHPALLDYLAIKFMKSGWDVKSLIKEIVMSSTYRQSSILRDDLLVLDPENVFLWRGPSERLSAEMMRDNALAASGLLVKKVGGPSVKPYQPEGLWAINGGRYERQREENLYRRSLYTFWKRSVPNPTQAIFDAPNRSACIVSRQKTSTPLQALVLMNDPAYVEATKVMAETLTRSEDLKSAINETFMKLTGRNAIEEELEILLRLRQDEYNKFIQYPDKANGWLNSGDYIIKTEASDAEIAANAVVASTILNADATIIKR